MNTTVQISQSKWKEKYPNFCKLCNGWGAHKAHPYGQWGCECLKQGVCPRCGLENSLIDKEGHKCVMCGWAGYDHDRGLPGSTPPD